jgi:histidine ammonia-lyase
VIRVDGRSLRCADVAAAANTEGPLELDVSATAFRAADHAWRLAEELSTRRVVYGRTTGVGANKDDAVAGDDTVEHGLRLLRSHAGGSGEVLAGDRVRASVERPQCGFRGVERPESHIGELPGGVGQPKKTSASL